MTVMCGALRAKRAAEAGLRAKRAAEAELAREARREGHFSLENGPPERREATRFDARILETRMLSWISGCCLPVGLSQRETVR